MRHSNRFARDGTSISSANMFGRNFISFYATIGLGKAGISPVLIKNPALESVVAPPCHNVMVLPIPLRAKHMMKRISLFFSRGES